MPKWIVVDDETGDPIDVVDAPNSIRACARAAGLTKRPFFVMYQRGQWQPPEDIRPYVKAICQLKRYANSRDDGRWAYQSSDPLHDGVYGKAHELLRAIVKELHGQEVADEAMGRIYYGGCSSWYEDFCYAVEDALYENG